MKKIFTLAIAALMGLAATAQQMEQVAKMATPKKASMVSQLTKQNMFFKGEKPAKVAADAAADTVYYGLPDYAFHQGYTPQGMAYEGSYIIASIEDTLMFRNNSAKHNNYQYGWTLDGEEIVSNSDSLLYWIPGDDGLEADQFFYTPILMNETDSYQFGGEEGAIWTSPTEFVGMTKLDMTDESFGAYAWSSETDYFMGTGMIYRTDTLDTYVVFFGTPNAKMVIDTISLMWWSHTANPLPAKIGRAHV